MVGAVGLSQPGIGDMDTCYREFASAMCVRERLLPPSGASGSCFHTGTQYQKLDKKL